jgi:hypothetical protein
LWDQFFTQERFGRRDVDISIIPWQNHRSIPSSFFDLIKNPTPAEVHDWIKAAERETWRHIPRIKSHCAEERTLDLCVQRLRKRIVAETWTSSGSSNQLTVQASDGGGAGKLNHSYSFPNLVCLGGLGVLDKRLNRTSVIASSVEMKEPSAHVNQVASRGGSIICLLGDNSSKDLALLQMDKLIEENDSISSDVNNSFANLLESSPGSSEKFTTPRIEQDDADPSVSKAVISSSTFKSTIAAPDTDTTKPLPSPIQRLHDEARRGFLAQKIFGDGYIKTTHMANLYYRKSASHQNLTSLGGSGSPRLDEDKTYDHRSP